MVMDAIDVPEGGNRTGETHTGLDKSDLPGANLQEAKLRGAKIKNTDMQKANLSDVPGQLGREDDRGVSKNLERTKNVLRGWSPFQRTHP